MNRSVAFQICLFIGLGGGLSHGATWGRSNQTKSLLAGVVSTPSSNQVTVYPRSGNGTTAFVVSIAPGSDAYPGIGVKPTSGTWNLSAYGHVEARIFNTGAQPIHVGLRIDNAGRWQDNPWDTESAIIDPGKSATVKAIFGYSYGFKPGFALDSSSVVNVQIFALKADSPQSFRIESLEAGGQAHEKPSVAPEDTRTKPVNGVLFSPSLRDGKSVRVIDEGQASQQSTPTGSVAVFPASSTTGIVRVSPQVGRWDLTEQTEVDVVLRNTGTTPVTPRLRIESNGGQSDWFLSSKPLAPGAVFEYVLPFAHAIDLNHQSLTGPITSDAVSSVVIAAEPSAKDQRLDIRSIKAAMKIASIPSWLGSRPPVAGEWVKTLDDEFDGKTLNSRVWKVTGENYYDKSSHWSAKNVLLGNGMVRLRYEKKTGFHNDDPKRPASPYAVGYLDTYGLWTQKYGYFEARMKLPRSPGLWPAFWMMPERGLSVGPEQWKRQDTANGGMEFDIMEHLTRWGPYRYNIAMHYDGYEKDHKQIGSDRVYVEPDKEGFITCGLLWVPGHVEFFCNGREVLRWESPRVSTVQSDLMFTMPMGGWDNNALNDALLPADFTIDYVRVWQRKDLLEKG
ncbi:MAG: glycoside hydrolase family 16 protein [Fimbriimonas sp.]|nr:glycoside hydrolase family 16 protein [Fimbriimonas sp.]